MSVALGKILGIGTSGVLGTGVVLYGSYEVSKESVGGELEKGGVSLFKADETFKNEWDKLAEDAEKKDEETKLNLKGITNTDDSKKKEEKRKKLQDWCKTSSEDSYKHLFKSPDEKLLGLVKELCTYSIKKKLEGQNIATKAEEIKEDKLKTEKESLPEGLKEIKSLIEKIDQNGNKSKVQEKVFNWCSEGLEKEYKGESDDLYKNVEKFCKKS